MMIVKESNSREDTYRIGRELGEQAVPGQYDLILMDIQMPWRSGRRKDDIFTGICQRSWSR